MDRIKVVSGGQTGVDRAALDVAMELGIEVGGWCPRDRWAEDGRIPDEYPLVEVRSQNVHTRTQRNVECSSASLVITRGAPMGGARLTAEYAESMRRPLLVLDLIVSDDPVAEVVDWLDEVRPTILNVAGPKESGAPGIAEQASWVLLRAFERLAPWSGVFQRIRPSVM